MTDFNTLLVPLDKSEFSERAIAVATRLASKFDSKIVLLEALEFVGSHTPHFEDDLEQAKQRARQAVDSYLRDHQQRLQDQGFNVEIVMVEQDAAQAILAQAEAFEADVIVMATHGRGGVIRWAFGSVTDKVIRHSACPVFVVPINRN